MFASFIADIEKYAKKKLYSSVIPQSLGLWENISLCSDVLEGAWYLLYDDQKEPKRSETVKRFIRESIDSFHSTLVTESKISISLAVFGPLGAGKTFFLNFILNWGLPPEHRVENGPLPSGFGGSQTPLPIYVKYGKNVQVCLRKQKNGVSPDYDTWFTEPELGIDTLARVNSLLREKFQEVENFGDARCVEVQGPFPVFRRLKKRAMTSSGHLELEVDVEFVDVPGCGDETGNELINVELSRADVVLFFDWGKSGRPVSSEDIAQIFRRHEELEFTSRPKLVHVVNDREPSCLSGWNFDVLYSKKKEELKKAWSSFLASSLEDEAVPGCYKDVRAKLPQLNGEDLLEKLVEESEVIYFHSENSNVLASLQKVIDDHVVCVKIKQTIHPFLQNVHLVAKKLKTRIGNSISSEKKKGKAAEIKDVKVSFDIRPNINEATDVVTSYLAQTKWPPQSIGELLPLYDDFMHCSETLAFLKNLLRESLETFTRDLVYSFMNANWSTSQSVSADLTDVVEILCESRVQEFCAHHAPAYLRHVLEECKSPKLTALEKKKWLGADAEEKKGLCETFLLKVLFSFFPKKETRSKRLKNSHFYLIEQLKQDVKDLLAVRSFDDNANRTGILEVLFKKLKSVIDFCSKSIREINPHPCLDVEANISLPDKMVPASKDSEIPLQSSHDKIIKTVQQLLLKPASKGANAIRELEKKLNFGKNALEPPQSQNVNQHLWAKVLLNVLSDKDHFNVELDRALVLDRQDEEVYRLLTLAQKRLFAHQKSSAVCKIVGEQSLPENEIHVRKSVQEENCLEVLVSAGMSDKLNAINSTYMNKDPSHHLAPIFMPTIRPGPRPDIQGNYFLEQDPWSKDGFLDEELEEESDRMDEENKHESSPDSKLELNIFLVVESQHLKTCQSTIAGLRQPSNVNLMYIVLPQRGRGIGVTRAIIKMLAECFNFTLYWTIDDDIQFMYQFDGNDRRWHKCSLTRGLLFGQRVFQTCLQETVIKLSDDERDDLYEDVTSHSSWPSFAKKTRRRVRSLLINDTYFAEVQKNPALLHTPFADISEDCGGDPDKKEQLRACEQHFVEECRKRLFQDTLNHIAGVSLAHESTKRYDYMSKYPAADYMLSNQRYQVVLNNVPALKGRNFVTDEMIFREEEFQVNDPDKRNTPYYGIRGEDKLFCRALTVSGVIGYQVIRIVHSHKKLVNVFDRVSRSYLPSQSPYGSEDEDEDEDDDMRD